MNDFDDLRELEASFTDIGGLFCTPVADMRQQLRSVHAFVFDWDGVFNTGQKAEHGSSLFNEPDSMATNLLRFGYWLEHGVLPFTAVISGERNAAATYWTRREGFSACYFKTGNKTAAASHLCATFGLDPGQIAFVFDDVLDLPLAAQSGLRLFVRRKVNPLFNRFVIRNGYADYATAGESGAFAVREVCELLMGLRGNFDQTLRERIAFSERYTAYLGERNAVQTAFFTNENGAIVPRDLPPGT